jgi:endonuclease/exonuclease/phosphatase family metal-dependent hydrolase
MSSFRPWRVVLFLWSLGGPMLLLGCGPMGQPPPPPTSPADGYLFCFWNTENFFDDRVDGWTKQPDKSFDIWFANDKAALAQKIENLCKVLLGMNGGRGPDVIALAELESYYSAELLQKGLNQRLNNAADHYNTVLYKDPAGGRSIACGIISRLKADRTRLLGKKQRILETHLDVGGHELVVIASHWSSRISDKTGKGRAHYADQIYGRYKAMYLANPRVAFLVCGDFNDNPDDVSVTEHLHATGDLARVKAGGEPLLYNLFAQFYEKGEGSHYYRNKVYVFDQIAVSPGLLGGGELRVDVASAQIVKEMADSRGRPNRFGGPKDKRPLSARGASDHFPVTVRLKVGN